ncbi:MAG: hydroxyacylglutathione hydrolase [Rhodocyclaceae bacterium]|nr:hydroxyacylglutathione hydrolase [Rhodocyclaceae bacterium]
MNTTKRDAPMTAVTILSLPAFNDNYIWVLRSGMNVAVVDPGDATPVLAYLRESGATLSALLITHHHGDHIGGIDALIKAANAPVQVFGPARESIPGLTDPLQGGEHLSLPALALELEVLAVPGHTAGHLAYYGANLGTDGALFCGDTLFGAGCGRLFEGTAAQMQASLAKIAVLPAPTCVYCAHEYTQSNLGFALAVEPDNPITRQRAHTVAEQRARGLATVPLTLSEELATNPFLRWSSPEVIAAATVQLGHPPEDKVQTFAAIRRWKDGF